MMLCTVKYILFIQLSSNRMLRTLLCRKLSNEIFMEVFPLKEEFFSSWSLYIVNIPEDTLDVLAGQQSGQE